MTYWNCARGRLPAGKDTAENDSACQHPKDSVQFIYDNNAHTCTACGVILSDYACADELIEPLKWSAAGSHVAMKTYLSRYAKSDNIDSKKNVSWDIDTLERICDRCFIPAAIEIKVKCLLQSEEYTVRRTGQTNRDLALMCKALYSTCLEEGVGKSPKLLSSWFQIDERDFWTVYKQFSYSRKKISPSALLLEFSNELKLIDEGLSYINLQEIGNSADKIATSGSHVSKSPYVILAACIFLYLTNVRQKKVTMKRIANMCRITCTSLASLKKTLQSENIFNSSMTVAGESCAV